MVHRANRMTPFATLEASAAKGRFLGNRGDLHKADGTISQRLFNGKRWIVCSLQGRSGYRVPFDTPGRYTPLFFTDEATAFAAGHRPCAECRRPAYNRFVATWEKVHGLNAGTVRSGDIDTALHVARLDAKAQRTYPARFDSLPDGVFIHHPQNPGAAQVSRGSVRLWSHECYGEPFAVAADALVTVLTPKPLVAVLSAGFILERDKD